MCAGENNFLPVYKTMFVAIDIIEEDYKTTGECNLALARKTDPVPGSLAWALPKRSPYTKLLSQG